MFTPAPLAPPAIGSRMSQSRETSSTEIDSGKGRQTTRLTILGQVDSKAVSRRGFVQLVGSGIAMTGAVTACTKPRQAIVPFVRRPPEVTPGNALNFATAISHEGYGFGVLVESHSGRPTKIEGNPDHPDSKGRTSARDQAYLLGLYDTDRNGQLLLEGAPATWKKAAGFIATRADALAPQGGAGLRFLVEPETSPFIGDLRARIQQKYPNTRFVTYSSIADGSVAGAQASFGRPFEVRHDLRKAKVIVSLDADFLDDGAESVRLNREFADAREPGSNMSRLYVAEPFYTVTGGVADHRLRVRGSEIIAVAQRLVVELAGILGRDVLGAVADLAMAEPNAALDDKWIKVAARDLAANRGKSVVIPGRRQPAAVHAIANAINFALGNVGEQIKVLDPIRLDPNAGPEGIVALAAEMDAGKVDTLVILGNNPVYSAPADADFAAKLGKVRNVIYAGLYADETAKVAANYIPVAHSLESWGDARGLDGTVTLMQPLIDPLFSRVTNADILSLFLERGDRGAYVLLKEFWQKRASAQGSVPAGSSFDLQWEHWLARGVLDGSAAPVVTDVSVDAAAAGVAIAQLLGARGAGDSTGVELAFTVDPRILDGRFGNNAWLHELPHPHTKFTWDNAVVVGQATAARMGGLKTGDWANVTLGGKEVRGPVFVQPGLADESVSIFLGYGRQGAESVAAGVGFNIGSLRSSAAPWFVRGVTVEKIGNGYSFGISQTTESDEDREPVKVGTLAEAMDSHSAFRETLAHQRGDQQWEIHPPFDYSKQAYKWAMSIDLNKCTGCGACVIACQSENNIATVGREQVAIGREMHWIRIDRYYADAPNYDEDKNKQYDDSRVVHQPIACQHCETAPCEYVCPVNATVHSDEGLNEMVYNRCVGTRYCSNNCPYKVRRFNFLDFTGDPSEVRGMAYNPDVTVRSRGIMEKCTYCVQRIERARIDSRVEGRAIADGEIVTACQQTCPAGAIEFGSLNDKNSAVSKAQASPRRYDLLHEIATRPRTAFLARVRNPNPELG